MFSEGPLKFGDGLLNLLLGDIFLFGLHVDKDGIENISLRIVVRNYPIAPPRALLEV